MLVPLQILVIYEPSQPAVVAAPLAAPAEVQAAEDEEVALPGIGRARKPKKPRARNVKGDAAPPNPLAGAPADED